MKKKHTIKKTMLTYKTINRFEAEYITNQYTPSEIDGIELAAYTANMNECVHPEWKEDDIFNDFLRVLKIHKIAVIKKKAENQCSNCKYFTVCGDPERTEPCNGRELHSLRMCHNLEIENFTYIFTISVKFTKHLRKREII